ncbi:hypothetical protein Afil01_01600 [Actinorhabdospora filicis]|uniref:Uncharacterized protein n=1 Tax=Actinorhabdospora filicis TaxID=1785913 RepID=A0A9W6W6W6_9ACTN|nr:hypothetical protein [Actinorhabdospora filicis]GLZ75353.1 hypothetical protein Afil01_01600 [Actinorhabdospora filicis]
MNGFAPLALFLLGGILIGGVISIRKNKGPVLAMIIVAALAVLAVGGGILWLLPGGGS